jgi:hypothetical protein
MQHGRVNDQSTFYLKHHARERVGVHLRLVTRTRAYRRQTRCKSLQALWLSSHTRLILGTLGCGNLVVDMGLDESPSTNYDSLKNPALLAASRITCAASTSRCVFAQRDSMS